MLLSLCMITKNEEDCIGAAINSLKNVVDEIIVVDTGSTDSTAQIARKHGAKVIPYTWTDDFSAARNFSIDCAKGEWIVFIDSDETIDPQDAAKIPPLCESTNLCAFMVTQRNYTVDPRKQNFVPCNGKYPLFERSIGYIPVNRIGIFRNIPQIRFSGIIHETVAKSLRAMNAVVGLTDIAVHHYGHLNSQKTDEKSKYYLQLGMRQVELTPNEAKPYYETGLVYLEAGNLIEAEKYLLRCASLNPDYEDVLYNIAILYFKWHKFDIALEYFSQSEKKGKKQPESITARAIIHDFVSKPDEAVKILEHGLVTFPDNVSMKSTLAGLYFKTGSFSEASFLYGKLLETNPENADFAVGFANSKYNCGDYKSALNIALTYLNNVNFNPHLTILCLNIYERLTMWDEFECKLNEIQKKGLTEGEFFYLRAILEEGRGNIKMALSYYKEGLAKSPHLADEINSRLRKFKQLL